MGGREQTQRQDVLHRRCRRRQFPEQVERALPRIAEIKLFQGDNWVDKIFYGESVYGPLHDPMFIRKSDPKPEQLALWRKIATEIAKNRLPLHVHANLTDTIDGFLDQIEAINKEPRSRTSAGCSRTRISLTPPTSRA